MRIKKLREMILADYPKMTESDVARFICIIDMVFRNNSLRRHVEYMYDHLGSVNAYGLDTVPSKSGLHDWVQWFADMNEWVHELILKQAGDDAHGLLLGDSSGFSIIKYEDWEYAKKHQAWV